jgi:phosphatidylglycerophosphatase A
MRFLVLFIATGAFTGYAPVASGTFGTLVAIPLYIAFDRVLSFSTVAYVGLFLFAVWGSCHVAGRADVLLQEHDSHKIVVDEIVGYLAATLFLPPTWGNILAAFVLFRILDIVKPFPAGYVDERVPGGYGVVLDDVVSGIYANLLIRLGSLFL